MKLIFWLFIDSIISDFGEQILRKAPNIEGLEKTALLTTSNNYFGFFQFRWLQIISLLQKSVGFNYAPSSNCQFRSFDLKSNK
jgi:hypothetical protein